MDPQPELLSKENLRHIDKFKKNTVKEFSRLPQNIQEKHPLLNYGFGPTPRATYAYQHNKSVLDQQIEHYTHELHELEVPRNELGRTREQLTDQINELQEELQFIAGEIEYDSGQLIASLQEKEQIERGMSNNNSTRANSTLDRKIASLNSNLQLLQQQQERLIADIQRLQAEFDATEPEFRRLQKRIKWLIDFLMDAHDKRRLYNAKGGRSKRRRNRRKSTQRRRK